jgi:hypothetical protein
LSRRSSVVATSFLVLLVALIYVLSNNSGHTGFDFRMLIVPGLLLIGSGFFNRILVRQGTIRRASLSVFILGLWYVFLPFILEYIRAINLYDRWAKSGLPAPPEHKNLLVIGIILAITASTIFPYYTENILKLKEKGNHEQ